MIFRITFLLVFFKSSCLFSQVSDAEMETLKNKWRVELRFTAQDLAAAAPRAEKKSDFSDSIARLFLQDTFVVEQLLTRQLQKESSNLGINKAQLACAAEYEKLAEKYYAILLSKMKEDDKELVVSWEKARKSDMQEERLLIGKLMQPEYSGGGIEHSITYTKRLMNAQKEHVFTIVDFLLHLI